MIDRQLIKRYVDRQDPAAFQGLVERHGPAVLRTCRSLLPDLHEAEDAFQATFLILVRRAPSLRDPDLLGRWLVGVARRVAARSRRRLARQSAREKRWAQMHPTVEVREDWPLLETRRAVREELQRLPVAYRQPLSFCYLDGLTHEEAARKIGCPVGTVKVRLVRGRNLLRDRLDRRGIALGVAFLLLLLRRDARACSIEVLSEATVEAMRQAAASEAAAPRVVLPKAAIFPREVWGSGCAFQWRARFVIILIVLAASMAGGVILATQVRAARAATLAASERLATLLDAACP